MESSSVDYINCTFNVFIFERKRLKRHNKNWYFFINLFPRYDKQFLRLDSNSVYKNTREIYSETIKSI